MHTRRSELMCIGVERYYESQGFRTIGEFAVEEKDNWPGAVLEMRL